MSTTAIAWLLSYVFLMVRGLSSPVFIFCAYLLTFYTAPQFWWWGTPITSLPIRWNLVTAIALAFFAFFSTARDRKLSNVDYFFMTCLFVYIINALFVHNFLAVNPLRSEKEFDTLWKGVGLALVLRLVIYDIKSLNIALFTIVLLSSYIAYEVYFNGAGKMIKGRLEGIYFPGASESNGTAILNSMTLPFIGYFFIVNPLKYSRWIAFAVSPFVLNLILLCNSRGTYLGVAVSGLVMIAFSRGNARKYAILIGLGGIAAFLFLARSEQVWNRIFSMSANAEERDESAQSRLDYTKAALQMIGDHPFGSGGGATFYSDLGFSYIAPYGAPHPRAAHNGYMNIMGGWGIQGFTFLITAILSSLGTLFLSLRKLDPVRQNNTIFLGACIMAAMMGQLVSTCFGDYLDGEWFLWLSSFALAYAGCVHSNVLGADDLPIDATEEVEHEEDLH
jgi:putative inorganic carbon (HCO3(-)) transporter